jgi:fatty acid desaturase
MERHSLGRSVRRGAFRMRAAAVVELAWQFACVGGVMRFSAFLAIFMVLLLLWAGGFLVYHVASALIHLLLVFALVFFVMHVVRGVARK